MKWDDAAKARLMEMDALGYSSGEIAAELGVTKNAVVGKRYRLRNRPPERRVAAPRKPKPPVRFRFRTISVPENAHPLVRRLFLEMNTQKTTVMDVSERAGVSFNVIHKWKRRANPNIANLEACFNALGKTLVVKETAE